MFGALKSLQPDGTPYGGKATRLGDTELQAEMNNTGWVSRDVKGGGKTTVETKLFEDGSGTIVIRRQGEATPLSLTWSDDEHDLTYSVNVEVPK